MLRSRDWVCPHCQQTNLICLPDPPAGEQAATVEYPVAPDVPERESERPASPTPDRNAVTPAATAQSASGPSSSHSADLPSAEDISDEMLALHTVNPLSPSQGPSASGTSIGTTPAAFVGQTTSETTRIRSSHEEVRGFSGTGNATRRSAQKPPALLDGAICVLLTMVFAIICRRIF